MMLQVLGLLVPSAMVFCLGAWLALFPQREARRIERRMAAGDDRFFEEQRFYRSYPGLRDPHRVRRNGVVLMVLAAAGGCLAVVVDRF